MAIIEYTTEDHRAVITINRPDARNAVNGDVARGIEEAIDRLEADDSLWVGILTGVPPVFSAGADLKEINAGRAVDLTTARGGFGGITRRERTKPIIAAVDGPALAGGTEIALACDLIVASTNARFGHSGGQAQPGRGGRRALSHAAQAAFQRGDGADPHRRPDRRRNGPTTSAWSTSLCEPGQVLEEARELAGRVEANAPVAVRASRHVVLAATTDDEAAAWRLSSRGHGRRPWAAMTSRRA